MKKFTILTSLFILHLSFFTLSAQTITTVAGDYILGNGFSGDGGQATAAQFYTPMGVAVDASGNIYVVDQGNNVVRKVDGAGIMSTYAGNYAYGSGYSGDGGMATAAELNNPFGVAVDASGNILIADAGNNVVRKVNTSGAISTVAGKYSYGAGYSGDGGMATSAELNSPRGVSFDAFGSLYISDEGNNVIRKVKPTGIIGTVAGNHSYGAGYSGDGGNATAAELNHPDGITLDASGNLYIADVSNEVIRMMNGAGIISTVAGNNSYGVGFSGDGGVATAAELWFPYGVAVDGAGNLYIADLNNSAVRMVDVSGTITTVAGMGGNGGYSGDNGPATAAQLNSPDAVAFDQSGNMYIADYFDNVIRKVTSITLGINQTTSPTTFTTFPNPAQNVIHLQLQSEAKAELVEVYNIAGQKVQTSSHPSPLGEGASVSYALNISSLSDGVYFLKVQMQDGGSVVREVEIVR